MPRHAALLSSTYGRSVEGRPLQVFHTPTPTQEGKLRGTLLIGGIHGDERATIALLESYLQRLGTNPAGSAPLAIIPLANPDSFEHYTRYNARGIDLNRNFETGWSRESEEPPGSAPFSEPESSALRDWIVATEPRRIVAIHWALAEIDADGLQSNSLAEAMWAAMTPEQQRPYRLRLWQEAPLSPSPCPGSMGKWCGFGLRYPDGSRPAIVTLELPYTPEIARPEVLSDDHLETVHARWAEDSSGYMAAVEPGVHAMLTAACHFTA